MARVHAYALLVHPTLHVVPLLTVPFPTCAAETGSGAAGSAPAVTGPSTGGLGWGECGSCWSVGAYSERRIPVEQCGGALATDQTGWPYAITAQHTWQQAQHQVRSCEGNGWGLGLGGAHQVAAASGKVAQTISCPPHFGSARSISCSGALMKAVMQLMSFFRVLLVQSVPHPSRAAWWCISR